MNQPVTTQLPHNALEPSVPAMQAAYFQGHGGSEVVRVGAWARPVRQPGEVLIRVRASTVNQVDLYMRNSGQGITHRTPQIFGLDACGDIAALDEVGERCGLQVGQRVVIYPLQSCGRCEFCERGDPVLCTQANYLGEHQDGTWCEWLSVPAHQVFPAPEHLSDTQAAALGVNYLTAWRMLHTQARMKPWETALIFGIGGGVSLAALQLVKALGGRAIVTSRHPNKLARALTLGADVIIDSQQQDVAKAVLQATQGRGVDVVIENVGAAVWSSALKSLVRGGRIVTCGATSGDQPGADLRRLFIRQLQVYGSTLGNPAEFRALLTACERAPEHIAPVIDCCLPLSQAALALERLESGEQFGKIALEIGAKA